MEPKTEKEIIAMMKEDLREGKVTKEQAVEFFLKIIIEILIMMRRTKMMVIERLLSPNRADLILIAQMQDLDSIRKTAGEIGILPDIIKELIRKPAAATMN